MCMTILVLEWLCEWFFWFMLLSTTLWHTFRLYCDLYTNVAVPRYSVPRAVHIFWIEIYQIYRDRSLYLSEILWWHSAHHHCMLTAMAYMSRVKLIKRPLDWVRTNIGKLILKEISNLNIHFKNIKNAINLDFII